MSFEAAPANPKPANFGLHVQPDFDPLDLLPFAAAERCGCCASDPLMRTRSSPSSRLSVKRAWHVLMPRMR
jgi:hypothetical protein